MTRKIQYFFFFNGNAIAEPADNRKVISNGESNMVYLQDTANLLHHNTTTAQKALIKSWQRVCGLGEKHTSNTATFFETTHSNYTPYESKS